jgi:hypothetical protein
LTPAEARMLERKMKKRKRALRSVPDTEKERIIRFVFDPESIKKFSPGLKMIYALNDAPLFVQLEEIETEMGSTHL